MAGAARPRIGIVCLGVFALAFAAALIGADQAGSGSPGKSTIELTTAALDPGVTQLNWHTALPTVLSEPDRTLYRRLFALMANGGHAKADRLLPKLTDPILVGDVLAARYLSPSYKTSYGELVAWLDRYGDGPDAGAIYALAMSKKPITAASPQKPLSLATDGKAVRRAMAIENVACAAGKGRAAALRSARHRLAANDDKNALALIEKLATATDCPEATWIAGLSAFRLNDNATARQYFEALAETAGVPAPLAAAGAYWAARVHLRDQRPELVSLWLGTAAEHSRTFYGLLAQRSLGMTVRPTWDRDPLTAADLYATGNLPRVRHALALYEAGEYDRVEPLVLSLIERAAPEMRRALVPLIQLLDAPALEIALAKRAASADGRRHDTSTYPMPNWRPINGRPFDRAMIFALIRSESGFQSLALNPSGASGVMQLMPSTAQFMAKRAGVKGVNAASINKPEVSIALGQSYIEYLAEMPEISGGLFDLIAAYNAGPVALSRWQEARQSGDPLLFIEMLPSRETRDMIERVSADYWIYKMRLGEPTPSLDEAATNRWPRYESKTTRVLAKNE